MSGETIVNVEIDREDPVAAMQSLQNSVAQAWNISANRIKLIPGEYNPDVKPYDGTNAAEFIASIGAGLRVTAVALQSDEILNREFDVDNRIYDERAVYLGSTGRLLGAQFISVNYEPGKTASEYVQESTRFVLDYKDLGITLSCKTQGYTENIPPEKRAEVMLRIVDAYKKIRYSRYRQMPTTGTVDLGNGFKIFVLATDQEVLLERISDDATILRFSSKNSEVFRRAYPMIAEAFREIATMLVR